MAFHHRGELEERKVVCGVCNPSRDFIRRECQTSTPVELLQSQSSEEPLVSVRIGCPFEDGIGLEVRSTIAERFARPRAVFKDEHVAEQRLEGLHAKAAFPVCLPDVLRIPDRLLAIVSD